MEPMESPEEEIRAVLIDALAHALQQHNDAQNPRMAEYLRKALVALATESERAALVAVTRALFVALGLEPLSDENEKEAKR